MYPHLAAPTSSIVFMEYIRLIAVSRRQLKVEFTDYQIDDADEVSAGTITGPPRVAHPTLS